MFMQEQTSDNLCPFRFPATRAVSVALLWIATNYCGVIPTRSLVAFQKYQSELSLCHFACIPLEW